MDYVTKPFHFQEFTARVRAHVTIRKLQKQLRTKFDAQALELKQVNDAYGRFVPHEFLNCLNKEGITQVQLTDHEESEMSIVFAYIRDFTPLSESMNPQENCKCLNSYTSRVSPVIGQDHGFIDKCVGDEIMALFRAHPMTSFKRPSRCRSRSHSTINIAEAVATIRCASGSACMLAG